MQPKYLNIMKQLPAVLYISTFVNDETYSHLNDKAKSNFSFSANKYSSLIRRGLETKMGSKLSCIFSPAIGDCSVTGIKYFRPIVTDASPDGVYLGCLNVAILKQIVISLKIFHYSLKWYLGNFSASHKVVVTSSIQLPFFLGILLLKLFGVKVVQFVPDLHFLSIRVLPITEQGKKIDSAFV